MKYPQLVSTRAVNAISDWLVSRLEQLGVEAPQIYTRLLLSLLQSSVQINDPIEFSNLEKFFNSRKGNTKRYLPCDTDTLKKLNAIQCLREIVSSEHEIVTIEVLVDELFEKLKDIEKQSPSTENVDKLLVTTLSVVNENQPSQSNQQLLIEHNSNNVHLNKQYNKAIHELDTVAAKEVAIDIETDPKKRYYRAFPALTKEMEDSFRIWRRNAKSMTWPVDRNNTSISSSSSSSTLSTSFGSRGFIKGFDKNTDTENLDRNKKSNEELKSLSFRNDIVTATTAIGAKRKSKRRRNQALCKGKTIQNIRKNSSSAIVGDTSGNIGGKYFRNSSPTYWDTDFEGCWEMGRDLIKEFLVKQNMGNRNRSTSESDAYNVRNVNKTENNFIARKEPKSNTLENRDIVLEKLSNNSSPVMPIVDISFCCEDDADDTLASLSELTTDSLGAMQTEPRRLYQRDMLGKSRTINDEQSDFEQFKAKFNSNVEALWNDIEPDAAPDDIDSNIFSLPPLPMQTSSLSAIAPFTENLKNFWSNYYNQNLGMRGIPEQLNLSNSTIDTSFSTKDESSTSLSFNGSSSGLNIDAANTSDYYSMPANLDNFDKSVGGVRRDFIGRVNENRNTPVNMFLQNTIWSEVSQSGTGDTDESFYFKVWNSNKKWSQMDGVHDNKIHANEGPKTLDNAFQFPYNNTRIYKWSEGINAEPNQQQFDLPNNNAVIGAKTMMNNNAFRSMNKDIDCTDSNLVNSSPPSYSHTSMPYNWQSRESGYDPWKPNPMTEICDEFQKSNEKVIPPFDRASAKNQIKVTETNISLPNHSKSSAFVDYARVKAVVKTNVVESTSNRNCLQQMEHPNERYPDDENLLTSERTHFHPIKTFADGHVFDIPGDLDIIEYERSSSGYLYLDNDKYLEYTRSDNFMAEEDTTNSATSTAPLYASSNCDAAKAFAGNFNKKESEFVLKFRLRTTDMACQTENNETNPFDMNQIDINNLQAIEQHPLYIIFSGAQKGDKLPTTDFGCYDAINALNRAVAAAAKASSSLPLERHWLPHNSATCSFYPQSTVWNVAQNAQDIDDECDEVDFCSGDLLHDENSQCSALSQQWSMYEIGKQCRSKTHNVIGNPNRINNNENGVDINDAHTLWGMCAACNNEYRSIPANRMLRDELNEEADEIMSDLKYMQDLYIGRARNSVSSNSDCEIDDDESAINSYSFESKINSETMLTQEEFKEDDIDVQMKEDFNKSVKGEQMQTHDVLQQVNQLIVDLLHADNMSVNKDSVENSSTVSSMHKQFSGSLWFDGNSERNIWQPADNNDIFKPIDLFKHINEQKEDLTAYAGKKLTWEHDNLAELWRQKTPVQQMENASAEIKYSFEPPIDNAKNFVLEIENENNCEAMQLYISQNNIKVGENHAEMIDEQNCKKKQNRMEEFFNTNVKSSPNNFKNANRKRRHSASQNIFHHFPNAMSICNNNNANLGNLNKFSFKEPNELFVNTVFQCEGEDNDIDMQKILNTAMCGVLSKQKNRIQNNNADTQNYDILNDNIDDDAAGITTNMDTFRQPKQTIITCKYWTTIEPITDKTEAFDEVNTFSCLIDKNQSILNHVTMVTRPLTR
ncbi:uncharacterized protein LOC119670511 [Teleopsis dalmanni]|uniref:uncharacterized protein LOC119670511 n=1 Tax=Teleopsis dalmanni TaxID=139649 RepID=UPI0018CE84BB|nr:uncharacterized protein LOC119670511 [Teleopsis dalmanni]XP_037936716.1 uncharacterized protein LOC119670511 [Teleopsis dalmanni]XP_037936717.1 uncharacterized protein LOC119670511 [Teleopsis dalmanni]XP_037936718.1 uncharacterized protein LOC119670511 [Teleopsis dalmanni]